jgi:hypothetical protein
MGLVAGVRPSARDRALPELRGRQVRPAQTHPIQQQGHLRDVARDRDAVDDQDRGRPPDPVPVPDQRHRRPLSPAVPRRARPRGLQRTELPHRSMAERRSRLPGQARRDHRHRLERRPDRPDDRRRGRVAGDVPTVGDVGHPAQQPPDRRRAAGLPEGELRPDKRETRRLHHRLPAPAGRQEGGRRRRRRPSDVLRADLELARLRQDRLQLRRHDVQPRRQRAVVRIHGGEDPLDRQGSGDGRPPHPHRPPLRRPPPAVRHRLLRDVQQAQRRARQPPGNADQTGHRDRHPNRGQEPGRRHHHLGHRLRLRHRRPVPDGHRNRRRTHPQRPLGGRPADLPRPHDPRLPEPLLPRRPARGLRQQPPLRRPPGRLRAAAPEPGSRTEQHQDRGAGPSRASLDGRDGTTRGVLAVREAGPVLRRQHPRQEAGVPAQPRRPPHPRQVHGRGRGNRLRRLSDRRSG